MKTEEQLKLSFYKEVTTVDRKHGVVLVQHVDSGKVFVRKDLKHYDKSIFEFIKQGRLPGIPAIHDLIETGDALVVIEDYISGHSIAEKLESNTFGEQEAKEIVLQLCGILEPFHSHIPTIVHRDIKDTNVIIGNDGKVYLIDFDASKQVAEGRNRDTDLIGTEEYAAPEQYGFGQSDQRTDIYALGVLLNRMLTGEFPPERRSTGVFGEIVDKSTAIDPVNRYQNVHELAEALCSAEDISMDVVVEEQFRNDEYVEPQPAQGILKKILMHLPYPIRELPGFRSGIPWRFALAVVWYSLLVSFGFFGISKNPSYTQAQNRFYDLATFSFLFVPTLYLGNYLKIRDRFPWRKTYAKATDAVRIGVGAVLISFGVIFLFSVLALVFGM